MEHTILENIREAGTNRVYRLVVATEGIDLMHVTNTDGQNDYAGGSIKHHTDGAAGDQQMQNLREGQETLSEQMNPAVLDEVYSRSYSWGQIKNAEFGSDGLLNLEAGDDHLKLDLSNAPADEVQRFSAKLLSQLETAKAGRREMRSQR